MYLESLRLQQKGKKVKGAGREPDCKRGRGGAEAEGIERHKQHLYKRGKIRSDKRRGETKRGKKSQ